MKENCWLGGKEQKQILGQSAAMLEKQSAAEKEKLI